MERPQDWSGTSDAPQDPEILGIAASDAAQDPDEILGTPGDDWIVAEWMDPSILKGLAGDDGLVGNIADNSLFGGTGNDELYGDSGDDLLRGGPGMDEMQGGLGDDILFGGADADRLKGGSFFDNLLGGGGADELNGGSWDDNLYGGQGDDTVRGGGGNDRLEGSGGNDMLHGGAGNDTFVFIGLPPAAGEDTILDFKPGQDTIILTETNLPPGDPVPDGAFVASATGDALDGDDRILYETDTGKLFYDADGSGATEKVLIVILGRNTHPALTAADIEIDMILTI